LQARGLYRDTGFLFGRAFLDIKKGVISVLIFKICPYYRKPENHAMGRGVGYCDLGGGQGICEGDIQFCDRSDDLRKQLLEEKKKEQDDKKATGQKKKPSNYRVLVVDDEEPIRRLIVALLSEQGHQCMTANNGAEALNKMIQDKFDAVITDIVMPEKNGIALTKELLSLYPKLPIMAMTGFSKEYPAELALKAGARDFIVKPFSIDEFILRFNKMMRDHMILCQMETKQNEMVLRFRKWS
jgi:CheY-like chemotaxis protein